MTELLIAALNYAERGIPVFPCKDKRPLVAHGLNDASTDYDVIADWWAQWPNANIGIPIGKASGIIALDVDVKNGHNGDDSLYKLQQAHEPLPDTPIVLTPSDGHHRWFRRNGASIKNSAGLLGDGLDVRGDGGYVIAPPSRINGKSYEWEASSPKEIAPMPEWLINLTKKHVEPVKSSVSGEIPQGNRNNHLTSQAGAMRRRDMSQAAIEAALLEENQRCNPPLPVDEVKRIAASVGRYEPAATIVDDTEDGIALLFAEKSPHFRWVDNWGKWLVWDGKVWVKDKKLEVFNRVRALIRAVANDNNGSRLKKSATVAAVANLARCDERLIATDDQWDQDVYLLNTKAGIVNLFDGSISPHDSNKYMTRITACAPESGCPRWVQFLDEVTGGDGDLASFLQRVIGYSLTGSVKEHALFFFYGTGRNGKGVFLNTMEAILADYAGVAPIEALIESNNDRHPTELAGLMGKRLVIAQEPDSGVRWAEAKIKTLTGGDPITARYMRQDFFTFDPQFKLLIAGNHKPSFRSLDVALRARLHLIPFTITIPKQKRDPDLTEKLKTEWSGILQWAIDGAVMYRNQGLNPPSAVCNATDEYFEDEDVFNQWVEDKCQTGPDCWDTPTILFNSWKQYAEAGRYEVGTQKDFRQKLINAGYPPKRTKTDRRHIGIKTIIDHQLGWQDAY